MTTKPKFIDPVAQLGSLLLNVDKPARYTGGEFGILANSPEKKRASLRTLIAFPDLYEIGMGNQALKIIYNRMNLNKDILCDRAFAPAPDFENVLRENKVPLYGLDTGISLDSLDLLMFTIGYELALGGVLLMLDVSNIPLHCDKRAEEHPIVIAGGPAVSNPLPFSPFIDAFWIGEAEAGFFELAEELSQLKKSGSTRADLLNKISNHPNIWVKGKQKALRAIYTGFSSDENKAAVFPIPSMKIVHNHGSVEIMRGCPNGCRFCHAGFWYRPMRQKTIEKITKDVDDMVTKGGWQEISLSSLSSGDYCGIDSLVETLNKKYSRSHISFQMPSLKISGFSLELLKKISTTRKSGLTFAVETPDEGWQMSINKEVTLESVVSILEEAKKNGWKTAKFYFMIGLPFDGGSASVGTCDEEEKIVDFIINIARRTKMHFNINVGIFIPKPHTPFQNVTQLDNETAVKKMDFIRAKLKPMGHKVSIADPLISKIEGLLSRGDESAGLLFEQAFHGGSRLDAWNEYIKRDIWESLLCDIIKLPQEPVWKTVCSGLNREYLESESCKHQHTPSCTEKCSLCGVCNNKVRISKNITENAKNPDTIEKKAAVNLETAMVNKTDPDIYRMLFSFSKLESSVFHGHLSLIEIFSMAFRRGMIPVRYTKGFNPLAKIEFASPLSTGISAENEIALVDFVFDFSNESFVTKLNQNLPQGIRIGKAESFLIKSGMKKYSLASLFWGASYESGNNTDYVKAADEKTYRLARIENDNISKISLKRSSVLARNEEVHAKAQSTPRTQREFNDEWGSYFDVYKRLYSD